MSDKIAETKPAIKKLFADFAVRITAFVLDLMGTVLIWGSIRSFFNEPTGLSLIIQNISFLVIAILYFSVCWSSPMKASPVQFLFALRVVDQFGNRLRFRDSIFRSSSLLLLIAGLLSSFMVPQNKLFIITALPSLILLCLAAFTVNRQAAHDLLVKSVVVNNTTLKSEHLKDQLLQHIADNNPDTYKDRRPSILSIIGNVLVFLVPTFLLYVALKINFDQRLMYRTNYAVAQTKPLKVALIDYYEKNSKWPSLNEQQLDVATKVNYPAGGNYQLEEDGKIRIKFSIKAELKEGSILLSPELNGDQFIWNCRVEGNILDEHLPNACRRDNNIESH